MECDLKALRMSPAFRSRLLPICQRPTSSVQLHNKLSLSSRSLLLSVKLKPLSCAALEAFDLNPISDLALSNVPNSETQLHEVRVNNGSSTNEEMVGSNVKTRPRVFDSKKRLIRYSGMLRTCVLQGSLNEGKAIHGQLHAEAVKLGFFSDVFVGSALVGLYAKCGEMELADTVLFCMPEQNVVSWNALLNGYAQEGDGKQVLKLFAE
ncbi:pentatricopeptide repeat-containing protein [Prunus yedoensis var. nudiflora]|uniref:Pentatricopeptide repeat-containing protein n=1 Tax=Prunus yedoensis var. nudiflora TaxID=2094558 RepID=A0A314Z7Q9_PRUYE|nr:pentatricopeptide repeat-containing protein [Prunus yedoensis var. nudiflora]